MANKKCCLVTSKPDNSWTLKIKFWRHLPFIFLISVCLAYGFVIWFWWVVNTRAQLPFGATFSLLPPCPGWEAGLQAASKKCRCLHDWQAGSPGKHIQAGPVFWLTYFRSLTGGMRHARRALRWLSTVRGNSDGDGAWKEVMSQARGRAHLSAQPI